MHTQRGAHKRRSVATAKVLLFEGPQARWYTQKAVHTKGGAHKRRPVATAGVLLFKGPQARRYTHRRRRRRRRCGPPVGRTRGTSPWCPPALIGLAGDREGGSVPTRPAKHHGGGSPLRLLPLSPGPHNVHALPPYTLLDPPRGTEWGARRSAGSTSGTVHHPPKGRGTQSHGCGPLAHQVLPTGRRLAGRSRGLGPWPSPPPSPGTRHFCRRCPCAEPSSTSLRPRPRVLPKPPRGAPIPPRPRQDRRDSGVSAAVWGWVVWCPLKTPTGRPYPSPAQAGPEGLGCIRRCVGVGGVVSSHNPHGASLSLPGPGRTGGTQVYPPLCGGGWCGVPS